MEYPEDPGIVANYVRKALPLMIKHHIAPNPCNFALWYAYVSKQNPQLIKELDTAIETTGTCSSELSSKLFFKHIIKDDPAAFEEMRSAFNQLLGTLITDTHNTASSARHFSSNLKGDLQQINQLKNEGKLEQWLQNMLESSIHFNNITQSYSQQLNTAQQEISHLKLKLEDTQRAAHIDPLTKVANRRAFQWSLNNFLSTPSPSAILLLIDIDHFKRINDRHGHNMGDSVLCAVAQTIQNKLPENIQLVRYGGEEFAVLLENYNIDSASSLAEIIRQSAAKLIFRNKANGEDMAKITVSIGVSSYRQGDTIEEWTERCDQALYRAKSSGRNQVCFFKENNSVSI